MFTTWPLINAKQLMLDNYIQLLSYFKFLRISIFVLVLVMIHVWLENSIATVLITRLTGDGLALPKAASIVNVQDGLSAFLLLLVVFSQHSKLGSFLTVVLTTISYLGGLLLILYGAMKQKKGLSYLFVAALLIALGRSGRDISLREFLASQCKQEWSPHDEKDEEDIESYRETHWRIASLAGIFVSVSVAWIYKDMEWVVLCKISTIAMGVGFAFFVAGLPFYHRFNSPQQDSEIKASKLLLAAIRKKNLNNPASESTSHNRRIYREKFLRWVDKAAIIEESPSIFKQERRGRLHTIEHVHEVKKLLSLIPLWTTFLVYGLLQATGNVFFYEQVSYMNPKVGLITNVPVQIFAVIVSSISFVVSYCYKKWWAYKKKKASWHAMLIRIGMGLAIGPICCMIAWRVENYRLEKYVISEVYIDVVWLIPQFVLLGALDGLVSDGLEEFFYANVFNALRKYGPSFTQFIPNIGHFISLALVLNLRSLFGDSLDTSSLGSYYAILGYVCFVNFMFYCFMATYFVKRHEGEPQAEDGEEIADEEGITGLPLEELGQVIEELPLEELGQVIEELPLEDLGQVMEEIPQYEGITDQMMEEYHHVVEVEGNNQDFGNQEVR